VADDFCERYGDLLTGSYDCVDRNLLFASGGQMEVLFDRIVDRTRSRLDIPAVRTLFGVKTRPHRNRASGPPAQDIVIEKPRYGLSWFRIRFGLLQLKAYTKGEHVLRLEATVHNTKELRCRRGLDHFGEIITRLAGMAGRFATALDCADIGFLPDGTLDELPLPSQLGATRTGGIDLKKLRSKGLAVKPGRTRRYHVPTGAARTIAALLTLRDQVIGPILAGVRSPRMGRKPAIWTRIDRRYETLRIGMQDLFHDLGITATAAAA
jgi:hypothetical protein